MTDHPIRRDFDDAYSLVKGKSTDYAELENKFSNFEQAAIAAGVAVEQVFLVLIGVKLARLTQLMTTEKSPNFESIDDNLLDLINYPGLLRAYRRSKRAVTMRDIFDEFAREELSDETVDDILESKFASGLLDAVLDDPTWAMFDGGTFQPCTDPNCCGGEEEDDSDFLDAQVDDALAEMGEPPLTSVWSEGDEFMLTDQRIFTGYGAEKQVMEILESAGPYTIQAVVIDRVRFEDENGRSLTAKFSEIEPVDEELAGVVEDMEGEDFAIVWDDAAEAEWEPGDRFILTDDRIFRSWRRDEEPTDRVMSSIGPYEVVFTSKNPAGQPQVHFKGVEFEDRTLQGGTWFARYSEIERV